MPTRAFPLRLAVGLGQLERERALLPALCDGGDFALAARCLAADELLEQVRPGAVDAALVADDLLRWSEDTLRALLQTRVPLVLLADAAPALPVGCVVLPRAAAAPDVRAALLAVAGKPAPPTSPAIPADAPPAQTANPAADPPAECSIIAMWSGPGERWRSRLAVELAAGLGAVADTFLVDADLTGPSVHALLDADPTRNLVTLLHADPDTPRAWERALDAEAQPLHPRSPRARVLCGLPTPELRGGVGAAAVERLVDALAARCRYLVLDVGAELYGDVGAAHRAALRRAERVLLVAAPDLAGLWQARTALRLWRDQLRLDDARLALVLAGWDARWQHGRAEVEWALRLPTAAVIPHDRRALQRALAEQRPLVLDDRSRAARALLDLAGRLHGGALALPPEPVAPPARRRRSWRVPRPRLPRLPRRRAQKGAVDGEPVATAH